MNKKMLLLLLVCSVALNLGFVGVYAFNMISRLDATPSKDCPYTLKSGYLYTTLGLNQTQLERIEPLVREFHEKVAAIRGKGIEQRDRLVEAMAQETVDRATIDAIQRNIAARQSEMQQLVVNHILSMKEVMNPEQRSRFFESMRRNFGMQNFMNR